MTASLINHAEAASITASHCTVAEAADRIGCSESTIRKLGKSLGIARFAGQSVAGFLRINAQPVPVVIAYAR